MKKKLEKFKQRVTPSQSRLQINEDDVEYQFHQYSIELDIEEP